MVVYKRAYVTTVKFSLLSFIMWVFLLPIIFANENSCHGGCWVIDFNRANNFVNASYDNSQQRIFMEWQQLIMRIQPYSENDKISAINDFFHQNISYRADILVHGIEDFWATPLELIGQGVGDCEDYAIAKYITLRLAGVESSKLRLIYVRARIGGETSNISQAHMVLGYYPTPTAEPLILDSLQRAIQPASQRADLTPVFSFNSEGLWAGTTNRRSTSSPVSRLSSWQRVIERMEQQGISLELK